MGRLSLLGPTSIAFEKALLPEFLELLFVLQLDFPPLQELVLIVLLPLLHLPSILILLLVMQILEPLQLLLREGLEGLVNFLSQLVEIGIGKLLAELAELFSPEEEIGGDGFFGVLGNVELLNGLFELLL